MILQVVTNITLAIDRLWVQRVFNMSSTPDFDGLLPTLKVYPGNVDLGCSGSAEKPLKTRLIGRLPSWFYCVSSVKDRDGI